MRPIIDSRAPAGCFRALVPSCFMAMLIVAATTAQSPSSTDSSSSGSSTCSPSHASSIVNVQLPGNDARGGGLSAKDTTSPSRDCAELKDAGFQQSGRYTVTPDDGEGSFFVFCDMETEGGGWTVFQRRENGIVDFYRTWNDYRNGFGLVVGEHWLGNEKIHRLTSQKRYVLRVEVQDWEDGATYAEYDLFIVLEEASHYKLVVGNYRGTAGDSLEYHSGMSFTTRDADHDTNDGNCAELFHGAWWYDSCHWSNMNGQYYEGDDVSDDQGRGVVWYHWKDSHYTLKATEMKIRPA